jgi:hypothetical protein
LIRLETNSKIFFAKYELKPVISKNYISQIFMNPHGVIIDNHYYGSLSAMALALHGVAASAVMHMDAAETRVVDDV